MPITNYEERYLKNYYATYQIALSMKRYINQMNDIIRKKS